MLGFRMYDNETGRFTTPDLLWSAFPAQMPYHYVYNSPMTYRDPSGLAQEKEKEGEELMSMFIDWDYINEARQGVLDENVRRSIIHMTEAFNRNFNIQFGGGGGRTGASYTFNGTTTSITYNSDGTVKSTTTTHKYTTHIPTSFGNKDIPTTVDDMCGDPNAVMDAFVGGINDILDANPRFFDHLWGRDINVDIMHSSKIFANGKQAIGKEGPQTNGSIITLAGDILTGQRKEPYSDGDCPQCYQSTDKRDTWQNYAYIGHEFAHALHRTIAGNDFLLYSSDLKEHFAVSTENSLRSFYGDLHRYNEYGFSMGLVNKIFYPGTWELWNNYNKRGY